MNPYEDEDLSYAPEEPDFLADEVHPGEPFPPYQEREEPPYDFPSDEQEPEEDETADLGNTMTSDSSPAIPAVMLEIVQTVAAHSGQLQEQEQSITWLLDHFKEKSEDEPVFWSWRYVTGEERTMLWEELTNFVSWINHRYFADSRSKQIIPCWYRHGAIVEELTGLWAAWRAASFNAKKPNAKMADFHRRYFWPTMDKVALLSDSCSKKGEHTVYGDGQVRDDDAEMTHFMVEDVARFTADTASATKE